MPQTDARAMQAGGFIAQSPGAPRRRTLEFYERSAKIWEPFRDMRIPQLRRAAVEDFITARAAEHARSAKNELEFRKRVLREAKARGQRG